MAKIETLADINFGDIYQRHFKQANRSISTPAFWDDRAEQLRAAGVSLSQMAENHYLSALIDKIAVESTDTILDVGCGAGHLTLQLAPKVKQVYGLDFSEKMLALFAESANSFNIDNYETLLKSWYESWDEVPECDICISSRSSMVPNIAQALDHLNQKARKAVYMTMLVDREFLNRALYKLLNRDHLLRFPSYIYAVNILHQQGYLVTVDFIQSDHSPQTHIYDESGFIEAAESIIGSLTDTEIELLREYYKGNSDNLMPLNTVDRIWALLSWYK